MSYIHYGYATYCFGLHITIYTLQSGVTLLIEKWDKEHGTLSDQDPIEMLKALMTDHHLKAKDLVEIVGLSKGTISKILNYHTGLSKQTIRKLSAHFKVSQEAFNRPFPLKNQTNRHYKNARLMNTRKNMNDLQTAR